MSASRFASSVLALALAACIAPVSIRAQVRDVISKEISVGRSGASLALEFRGGDRLAISFEDGSVLVDGEAAGSYTAGDALDTTWRTLLGQAVALDDGPLATALAGWSAPSELAGDAAATARAIDQALESALRSTSVQARAGDVSVSLGDPGSLVRLLLREPERLRVLGTLAGVDDDVRLYVAEDAVIAADETVEGDLIVIDADARIEGTIEGDVIVVGGELELLDGSFVAGSVRLADARLVRSLGDIEGDVVDLEDGVQAEVGQDLRRELQEEIRAELREDSRDDDRTLFAPLRSLGGGIADVLGHLVVIALLGLAGAALISFAGDRVEVIADAARRAPGRAAAVGVAGVILLIPAWVIGFVVLLVSIVGIPFAIAWLPAFPIAACVAALVGYLAIARNAGEWLADSDLPWTHWIRRSNSLLIMVGGLLGLSVLFLIAHVSSILPFLGFVTGLLVFAGVIVTVVAIQIGFGAVILTRGGQRREDGRYTADEAWDAAMHADAYGGTDGPTATGAPTTGGEA